MTSVGKWKNEKPKKYFRIALGCCGKPTFVANVPNGMVYWKKIGHSLFAEHRLQDQEIPHCVPKPHYDFFYSSIKFYVPPETRLDVLSISGSVNYDGLTKLLTARCASLEANIATLFLCLSVASGVLKIKEVKKQGLYAAYIQGKEKPYTIMRTEMGKMKKVNHQTYATQLAAPSDPLAFSACPPASTKQNERKKKSR